LNRNKFHFHGRNTLPVRGCVRALFHQGRFSVFCFQIERIILLRFKSASTICFQGAARRSQTRLGVHIMYDMCTHECGNTARGAHIYHLACVLRSTHRASRTLSGNFLDISLAEPVDASIFPAGMLPANRLMRFTNPQQHFFSLSEMENRCRRQMILLCVSFSQQSNGRILSFLCMHGYH
jgi:hypothetical protein